MSPRPHILTGLYAITDNNLIPKQRFIETVELAIIGGAKIIQYRDKSDDKKHRLQQAHALKQLCHHYQIPLLINDDIALAQQVGAEGVHLGKEDVSLSTARAVLGEKAIIGVSCYNQLPLALKAIEAGATYVAYGRFFPSQSKPNAIQANIALLHQTRQQLDCPLVAIGGITPDNGSELIKAGVNCLAVIQGLFGQPDVKVAAQRYAQLFA
ncbi:Thiamine monophosphate synthase [Beggiatoa sp. PS]|nr:Thiamine monophosphate synthase [Beggiatoa sp. PS]